MIDFGFLNTLYSHLDYINYSQLQQSNFKREMKTPRRLSFKGVHPVSGHGGRRKLADTIDITKKPGLKYFWRADLSNFFDEKNFEVRSAPTDFVTEIS